MEIREQVDQNSKAAKYEKIALDIAYGILSGEWVVGDIITGRTTLSAKYSVSSETIRRALKLLEEQSVVESIERKGILIKSKEFADLFVREHKTKDKILSLREDVSTMMLEKQKIENIVLDSIDDIIEKSMLLRNTGVINPLEITVSETSELIGKSIGEVKFWECTGATVIGINRNNHLYLSPGPAFIFESNDRILYVSNDIESSNKIKSFVNK
ncbi:MAG: TrkA C-terminal domain-containing protein [Acidaminobacteraceae bacterium]